MEVNENMETKFCKFCGEKIDRDSIICPECGKKLVSDESDTPITEGAINSTENIAAQVPENAIKDFWKKEWFMWVSLVFVPPLGLILLWAVNKRFGNVKKAVLTLAFLVWASIIYAPSDTNSTENKDSKAPKVVVADFKAISRAEVDSWCNTNKMNCVFTDDYSDTVKKGGFISQSNEAGSSLREGSSITITYSLGKEPSPEFKNALKKAESYSEYQHMSKKSIYEQLTSEYGEGFPKDAAQYAVDNLKADYNKNALEKAKSYSEYQHMSKNAIFEQLISEYGEKFTRSEAQYAIDNLYK